MKEPMYRQNNNVITRDEGNEAMLFNPESSAITILNSSGYFVWSLCSSKIAKEEIVKQLIQEFDVSPKRAQKDLELFLANLEKGCFIEKS